MYSLFDATHWTDSNDEAGWNVIENSEEERIKNLPAEDMLE